MTGPQTEYKGYPRFFMLGRSRTDEKFWRDQLADFERRYEERYGKLVKVDPSVSIGATFKRVFPKEPLANG